MACILDEKSDPVNNCTHCNNMTSICHRIGNGPFYECICSEGYQMNAVGTCVSKYFNQFASFYLKTNWHDNMDPCLIQY